MNRTNYFFMGGCVGVCWILSALLLTTGGPAGAVVPEPINVHGALLDPQGIPLTGQRAWRITFYTEETGGVAIATPFSGAVELTDRGIFNIAVTPPTEALNSPSLWYELAIDSDEPTDGDASDDVFPDRIAVYSVPFALRAKELPVEVPNAEALDQQNTMATMSGGTRANPWQSFTAATTGTLTKLSVYGHYNGPYSVTLKIYEGSGIGGNLIHSQALTLEAMMGWTQIDLSPPVPITSGSVYTYQFDGATIDIMDGADYGAGQNDAGTDYMFQTYVTPPPSIVDFRNRVYEKEAVYTKTESDDRFVSKFGDTIEELSLHTLRLHTVFPEVIDQYNENAQMSGDTRTDPWQSFTAGVSGTLNSIGLIGFSGGPHRVTLYIYEGQGVLGTQLSVTHLWLSATMGWSFMTLDTPVNITAGTEYTFCLSGVSIDMEDGQAYSGGVNDNGMDYLFRTYVSPISYQDTDKFFTTNTLETDSTTIKSLLNLKPVAGYPGGTPKAGDIYMDSTDSNRLKVYDGSTWHSLW